MERSKTDSVCLKSITESLENTQATFKTTLTNYTSRIECNDLNIKFLKSFRGKKCFAAYNQIKNDVCKHEPPYINENNLAYFFHDIQNNFYNRKAIQIDVTKAYATALKNRNYITDKTFKYISSLNKVDRLASVGMLASIRHEFKYKEGKIISYKTIESKLKNFFLYCVKTIQDIMNSCRLTSGNDYILTWVDAIYISFNEKLATKLQRLLYYNGFESERSIIHEFKGTVKQNKINISLYDGEKVKMFSIPHIQNETARHLIKYINRNKNDHSIKNRNR